MAILSPEERIIGQMNDSLYLTIPAAIVTKLNLKQGETLSVALQDGKIVASPTHRSPSAEEDQLIDQMIDEHMAAMKYLADK